MREWETSSEEWAVIRRKIDEFCDWFQDPHQISTIYRYLRTLKEGEIYLEIGTWMGCSAAFAALVTSPGVRIVTIDSGARFRGDLALYTEQVRRNFEKVGVKDKVEFLLGDSAEIPWNTPIHALFIDADPYKTSIYLKTWLPFLVPGGLLIIANYGRPSVPGVMEAVNELVSQDDWELLETVPFRAILRRCKRGDASW